MRRTGKEFRDGFGTGSFYIKLDIANVKEGDTLSTEDEVRLRMGYIMQSIRKLRRLSDEQREAARERAKALKLKSSRQEQSKYCCQWLTILPSYR